MELRKVDVFLVLLCVAVLAFGLWQMAHSGPSAVDGQLAVASKPYELPAAYITVTTNSYITPTYTLQPITSADAVFTSNLAAGVAGRLLILWNVADTTITISDTGTIMLSADWAGTQYDTLVLLSDGTNWLELARSTN